MKSTKYWDFFYKKKGLTNKNSNFSKFISIKNKDKKTIIYDIGCGNARDTFFLIKKNIFVTEQIDLKQLYKKIKKDIKK